MKIIEYSYTAVLTSLILGFFILGLTRCTIPQSKLVDSEKLAIECKTLLAVAHLHQKSKDKSSLIPIAQACKEANRFIRCEKYIKDRTLFAECRALLK